MFNAVTIIWPIVCVLQVEAVESKTVSSTCDLKVSRQESSSPPVRTQTSGYTSDGRTSSGEAENKAEVMRPQTKAQIPAKLPSQNSGSGEPVTASKSVESPQKSCAEEKRDMSKEEPHEGNKEEDAEGQFTGCPCFYVT